MKLLVTGAASRIGRAAVELIARELHPEMMILTDRPEVPEPLAALEAVRAKVLEVHPTCEVELRAHDLGLENQRSAWYDLPALDGLILLAAIGLVKGVPPEVIRRINCDSQLELAEEVLGHHANPNGCTFVFMQSIWGDKPENGSVHPDYDPIALTKNAAQRGLLELGRRYPQHRVSIVVSSMVERTYAALAFRKDLGKERFEAMVKTFPEGRLVRIEEAANGILAALRSPQGTTIFVPASAETLKSEEMQSI